MNLTANTIRLNLVHPFRISRSVSAYKENILVTLDDGEHVGVGEAAPSAYYGEDAATVHASLARVRDWLDMDVFALDVWDRQLQTAFPTQGSVRAAVEMALHDLIGKKLGLPLYRLFGLDPSRLPVTSFTIGIDDLSKIREKVRAAAGFPVLKIKLGTDRDLDILAAIREETNATLRVDANAGWDREQALRMVALLPAYGVELIEQPLKRDDLEGLRQLKEQSPIPIFVDESVLMASDVAKIAGFVDGINIKLMKCGGLREALRLIHVARAHGLKIMLGCMIETSVAITAAAHLASLVDFTDLDGNLLISNDPYRGVTAHNGRLHLPDLPGIGVTPVSQS